MCLKCNSFFTFSLFKPPFLWGCRNLVSINLVSPFPPLPGLHLNVEACRVPGIGRRHLVRRSAGHPCWPPPRCPPCHLAFSSCFTRWLLTHPLLQNMRLLSIQLSSQLFPGPHGHIGINCFLYTIPASDASKRLSKIFPHFSATHMDPTSAPPQTRAWEQHHLVGSSCFLALAGNPDTGPFLL